MAIPLIKETKDALGGESLPKCESRSLFKDRFADPLATDKTTPTRKDWFTSLTGKKAAAPSRSTWLPTHAHAETLHARLMSRLMVDLSGGVMENANVNLDRYGLPLIPGSAVKGCARRMALQALHDWIEAQQNKGSDERPATDDACAPCCEGFTKPADMLAAIARVFGWTPEDWKTDKKDGHYKSDFAWACAGNAELLAGAKSQNPPQDTFAGFIAFLAASPNRDPGLELDVVTPHHTIYHSPEPDRNRDRQKWENWQAHRSAPDTEDPVPVYFPAVKAQGESDHFTFPLIPLRLAKNGDLAHARRWLAHGLELFGIGAKTNAGYGWFDASEALQQAVLAKQKSDAERRQKEQSERLEAEKQQAQSQARAEAKAALETALAGLTPEQQEDKKIEFFTAQQFDSKLRAFCKDTKRGGPSEAEKQAIVRALRGPRVDVWQAFKAKATKGEPATIDQAIRALCKSMNLGKMP